MKLKDVAYKQLKNLGDAGFSSDDVSDFVLSLENQVEVGSRDHIALAEIAFYYDIFESKSYRFNKEVVSYYQNNKEIFIRLLRECDYTAYEHGTEIAKILVDNFKYLDKELISRGYGSIIRRLFFLFVPAAGVSQCFYLSAS